ncbi:MAG: oligosaccharide flippase family protein [Candidatus Cloacimonadota bacterium]|nr:oligosaccharide flippase family protein [Candidatus Cloacimonadota bacterium]
MNNVKKTSTHLAIYAAGNLVIKLIGLVLLPIYTSHLSVKDFGIYAIFEISAQIAIAVIGLNLSTGMLKWISDELDFSKRGEIIFTTFVMSFSIAILFSISLFFSANYLSQTFFGNSKYSLIISFLSINICLEIINKIPINVIRYLEKPAFYSVTLIIRFLVSTIAIIFFVVYQNLGISGIFLGFIIGNIVYFFSTLPIIKSKMKFVFNKDKATEIMNFSAPMVLGSLSMMLFTSSDRYIIKIFRPFEEVGLYSFAAKISNIVNLLIVQSFNLALLPMFLKIYKFEKGKQFLISISKLIVILIGFILIGISYFGYDFLNLLIVNNNYLKSFNIIIILVFAYIFNALRYIFMLQLYASEKTKVISFLMLFTAITNILLNVIFINIWHYKGAAYATLISTILMTFGFYYYGQKYYAVKYRVGQFSIIIISTLLFLLFAKFIPNSTVFYILKIILLFVYLGWLYFLKIFNLKLS